MYQHGASQDQRHLRGNSFQNNTAKIVSKKMSSKNSARYLMNNNASNGKAPFLPGAQYTNGNVVNGMFNKQQLSFKE